MEKIFRTLFFTSLAWSGFVLSNAFVATAGTTGAIDGFAFDTNLHPLAGVGVTAVAPSGIGKTVSAADGFYSLNGLPLDVYTVNFTKDGYNPQSTTGVIAVQDQTVRLNVRLQLGVKTLARIIARAASSLVQPTVTADTYIISEGRAAEINGTPQDPNGFQTFNALPGITTDTGGFPAIRGGAQNDTEFTYDGVDQTDVLLAGFLNAASLNGTRSVELSTGGFDVSAGNTNTGVINQVIKRGAYRGDGRVTARVNGPTYGHDLSFDFGAATPDNRFSSYFSFGGQIDAISYGDRARTLPLQLGNQSFSTTMDDVFNLFYHFGQGQKYEVQLLSDLSAGTNSYGNLLDPSLAPYASANGNVQAASDPFGLGQQPAGQPSTFQSDYTTLFPGQRSYRQRVGAADTFTFNSIIDKLNFKRQLSPSSFAEVRLFRGTENFVSRRPYGSGSFTEFFANVQSTGFGEAFDYANQVNSKHEVGLGGDAVYYKNDRNFGAASPSLEPRFEPLEDLGCGQIAAAISAGLLSPTGGIASTPGIGGCYIAPFDRALNIAVPGLGLPTDFAHAPMSTYESDFINVNDPVHRYDLWLKDRYQPSDQLTLTLGLRWDKEVIALPADAALQNTTYYISDSGNVVTVPGRPIGSDVTQPQQVSPRFGASYQVTPRDVLRFSVGENIKFAPLYAIERAFHVPDSFRQCTIVSGCFQRLPGFGTTNFVSNLHDQIVLDLTTHANAQYAPVLPQTSINYDFSLEHDFGHGLELRLTPYYRKGFNYAVTNQPLLFTLKSGTPVFGPSNQESSGINKNAGFEFVVQRQAQNGLSGMVDMTYDNTLANTDGNFFPAANNAALVAGHFFHVTYVPSVQGTLNLVFNSPRGWYASMTAPYQTGYRYGVGKKTFVFAGGLPKQVLNSDLASPSSQAYYFTDPANPGTILRPNITSSRGTPEGDDPGSLLTPSIALVNLTLARDIGTGARNAALGIRVQNLFGSYSPVVIPANIYYVPQGVGAHGPGSGFNTNACAPGQTVGCEPFMYNYGPNPYEYEPSGPPRTYTLFISIKY